MNLINFFKTLFKKKEPIDEGVYIKTNLRCPKCKSGDLLIDQKSHYTISYKCTNGKIDLKEHDPTIDNSFPLDAICYKCWHEWTVRNKSSILELDSEPKKIENGKS